MNNPEADEWEIKSLQTRYKQTLNIELDNGQAEKILLFEEERDSGNSKFFFSVWEELEFEYVNFKNILTPAQFDKYAKEHPVQIQKIEEGLILDDKQYTSQLHAQEDKLKYYKDVLIPELNTVLLPLPLSLSRDAEKIAFIKSEYNKYLINGRKQKLVEHFRHFRRFQPQLLTLTMLLHEQVCLYPDYFPFKREMDYPTKVVADYLLEKLSYAYDSFYGAVKETLKNLDAFNSQNINKHLGVLRGWHAEGPALSKIEELMFVILFDPKKYSKSVASDD